MAMSPDPNEIERIRRMFEKQTGIHKEEGPRTTYHTPQVNPGLDKYFKPIVSRSSLPKEIQNRNHIFSYEVNSLEDMIEFMENHQGNFHEKARRGGHRASEKEDMDEWSGARTYRDAINILKNGHDVDHAQDMLKIISREVQREIPVPEYTFNHTGLSVDMGKFMEGTPECFIDSPEVYETEKAINIDINASYSSFVNQERIIKNMMRVVAYVQHLEKQRVRTQITMWFVDNILNEHPEYSSIRDYMMVIKMTLKTYNQPVDVRKLTACLHPVFFRRGTFKFQEVTGMVCSGYGRPAGRNIKNMYFLDDGATIDGKPIGDLIKALLNE